MTSAPRSAPRLPLLVRWGRGLAAHFISLILSLTAWTIIFSLFVTSIPLVVIWVGLPLLAITLFASQAYARAKKTMAVWQGASDWEELEPVPHRRGPMGWMWAQLRSPEMWRQVAYCLVGSLIDWVLALIVFSVLFFGLAEVVSPLIPMLTGGSSSSGLFYSIGPLMCDPDSMSCGYAGGHLSQSALLFADFVFGVIALIIFVLIVRPLALAQIGLTRFFLAPSRRAVAARLSALEQAKTAGEQAETANLSRIERDLHDGPQQSLIRNSMDLAALQRRLDDGDTVGAGEILSEVRARNDSTLADIRALSRGFAPPVLADKGLRDAVYSLAATSPIPVSVTVELGGRRLPEPIERAVYFAVSESLANAVKHSGATLIEISLRQSESGVTAEIRDNGHGGAVVLPGHGLSGLQDRLASVGGLVTIASSPAGTTIRVDTSLR